MVRSRTGRIGSLSLAVAGLALGLSLSAADETAPELAPAPAAQAETKPGAEPVAVPPVVVVDNIFCSGGVSVDGVWLLYTVAAPDGRGEPQICARNLKTQEVKKLGVVAWQGSKDLKGPKQLVMIPRAASADLAQVWVSAFNDRLWRWEPATGKVEACSTPSNDTWVQTERVPGGSADGKHFAMIESRRLLAVIDATTGKIVERVERPGKNTFLDEVHWAGNRLILTSPYNLGAGDLIQLWPKNEEARWKPLLKAGELKVEWVGAQGEKVVVRTAARLCRWSPAAPDELGELAQLLPDQQVLVEPIKGNLVLTRLLLPPAANTPADAVPFNKVTEPTLELIELDVDGKRLFPEAKKLSLATALAAIQTLADAKIDREREHFAAQLRAQPVVARGGRMLIRLQRENRYGFMGHVFETVAVVDLGATAKVTALPDPIFQFTSSGVDTGGTPEFFALESQGVCVAQQNQTVRIYRLP